MVQQPWYQRGRTRLRDRWHLLRGRDSLTLADMRIILSRITYHPDTTIYIDPETTRFAITIKNVQCSCGCRKVISLDHDRRIPLLWSEKDFLEFVWESFEIIAEHEACEWFKLDGQHIKNPHPELKEKVDA